MQPARTGGVQVITFKFKPLLSRDSPAPLPRCAVRSTFYLLQVPNITSWTTKEAAYKALPSPVRWKDLDLSYAPNGRPLLALRDPSPSLLVSISHDAGVVVAAVVACD